MIALGLSTGFNGILGVIAPVTFGTINDSVGNMTLSLWIAAIMVIVSGKFSSFIFSTKLSFSLDDFCNCGFYSEAIVVEISENSTSGLFQSGRSGVY